MKRLLLIVLLGTLSVSVAAAQSARARLDAFTQGIHALSCRFTQVTTDAQGVVKSTLQGQLALAAPRQFRWQTAPPSAQLIVADGARVWIYDPDLDQVTVRRQSSAEAHSPLTVLTDLKQMDKEFKTAELGQRDGLQWLQLTPRVADGEFQHAELGFNAAGELAQMRFENSLGGRSEIRFADWQRNPALPPSSFEFTPPAGADVIGDAVEVPEVRPLGN
ncbi:MAG TPA: outer membrane lipoprotein chaperone LolA [Rhodanobacteraceae bacterium]|nr:outer membrane lipoprotein chaperone LolA [Rhodanobacteraceae bacterium]